MGNMMLEAFTLGSQAVQRCSNCEDDFITSEIDATFFSYNKPDGASQQRTTFLELFEEGFSTTSGSTLHEELDHHNLDVVYSRLPSLQVEEYRLETSSRKQLMGCNLPSVSNPAISTNSVKLDYHEEELLLCKNNLFMQSAVRINSIPRDHDGITNLTYSSQKAARVGGDFEDEVAGAATIDGTAGLEYSSSSNATLKGSPTSRPNISVAAASSSLIISSSSTALLNANNATAASAGVPASAASCCEGGGGGGEMELLNDNYGAVSNIVRDDDQVVQNLRWPSTSAAGARASKRRKRSRARKNSEEMEHQRRTHIAVERNRRKQMNEHLSALRSLMPASYIQRGDQASIVGGAIQFVRELEQVLHSLQVQKQLQAAAAGHDYSNLNGAPAGMSEIESSTVGMQQEELMMQQERAVCKYRPLASTATELPELGVGATSCCLLLPNSYNSYLAAASLDQAGEHGEAEVLYAESKSPTATVEVKMMGSSFAQVKVLAQKRPRLLLHALATMGDLHLLVLHLNITTIDHTVLYSFNLEMGTECQLQLANDLADSMQQIFGAVEVMQELQLKEPCHQ